MKPLLITGANGLIGSAMVQHFHELGWDVHGVDNNMRADFFGPAGDTRWNQARLTEKFKAFRHLNIDIRDRQGIDSCIEEIRPHLIVHAAAQPSHDLAATRPFDDFDINASGTLNLLEATRRHAPEAVFVHLSTNKVYGDRPNEIKVRELPTRWDYENKSFFEGITEECRIDKSKHSLFGASKVDRK